MRDIFDFLNSKKSYTLSRGMWYTLWVIYACAMLSMFVDGLIFILGG